MKQLRQFMAIIEREGDSYVALCPELDIASQGSTVEKARRNLAEALELFFKTADASEIQRRLQSEVFHTSGGCGWAGYACCPVGRYAASSKNTASCRFVNVGATLSCRKGVKVPPCPFLFQITMRFRAPYGLSSGKQECHAS